MFAPEYSPKCRCLCHVAPDSCSHLKACCCPHQFRVEKDCGDCAAILAVVVPLVA